MYLSIHVFIYTNLATLLPPHAGIRARELKFSPSPWQSRRSPSRQTGDPVYSVCVAHLQVCLGTKVSECKFGKFGSVFLSHVLLQEFVWNVQ